MTAALRVVNLPAIVVIALVLVVWEALVRLGAITLTSIPAPSDVLSSLISLTVSGALIVPLLHTLWVVVVGSILAVVLGIALGSALGLSTRVHDWSMASVDFLRTIPVVALLPVAVLAWGPSTGTELMITVWAATWIMTVNTAGAYRSVHPRLADVAVTYRLGRASTFRKIWLPAIAPSILVGARLATVTACLTAIIAETLVNPQGLGWQIIRSQQALRTDDLWAYAFVAGLFGYLLNVVLVVLVRALTPGGRENPALAGA